MALGLFEVFGNPLDVRKSNHNLTTYHHKFQNRGTMANSSGTEPSSTPNAHKEAKGAETHPNPTFQLFGACCNRGPQRLHDHTPKTRGIPETMVCRLLLLMWFVGH